MKISDLSKIDLKDIDLKKIQESLLQRPELLINLGIAFFAGILIFNIVGGRMNEAKKLKGKMAEQKKKVAAIKTHEVTQKEFKELIDHLPAGILEDSLVDHLTDFAGKRNIQIQSFSPANKTQKNYYTQMTVLLKVAAKNYKDMILFLNDIESSPYNLRIDRWTGTMEAEKDEGKEGIIVAQLEINAVNFVK